MIIYLDESIVDQFERFTDRLDTNLFLIDSIIAADHFGKHAVFISHKLTDYLSKYFKDKHKKNGLRRIDSQTTQLAALARHVNIVLVVTADSGPANPPKCLEDKILLVKWGLLQESIFSSSTILLGENLDDCDFYKFIAKYYRAINKISGYTCRCNANLGGGSTIHTTYYNHVFIQHVLCLCLVDSDKHFDGPHAACGNTLHLLETVQRKNSTNPFSVLGKVLPLSVLEIENLIPLVVLKACFSSEACCRPGLSIVEKFIQSFPPDEHNPALYYDFKKGLRIKDCAKPITSDISKYWQKIFIILGDEIVTDYDEQDPQTLGKEIMDKYIRAGITNNKLLKRATDYMKEHYASDTACSELVLDEHLKELWINIGRTVFSWCCASPIRSGV